MAVGGVIAATHMPAGQADAQMQPAPADRQAVLAAVHGLGELEHAYLVEVAARRHGTTSVSLLAAGVRGARAGIYMPADPIVGDSARQEFYAGHAEDQFEVLSLHAGVHTPAASSRDALLTQETTRLEPGTVDHKLYVRGIGTVREQTVHGGSEKFVLVRVKARVAALD